MRIDWSMNVFTLIINFAAEDDEEEDIDANEVCAQIEALGGVVIDSFDADAVSCQDVFN